MSDTSVIDEFSSGVVESLGALALILRSGPCTCMDFGLSRCFHCSNKRRQSIIGRNIAKYPTVYDSLKVVSIHQKHNEWTIVVS